MLERSNLARIGWGHTHNAPSPHVRLHKIRIPWQEGGRAALSAHRLERGENRTPRKRSAPAPAGTTSEPANNPSYPSVPGPRAIRPRSVVSTTWINYRILLKGWK